jgi:hypothetical protein
MAATQEVSSAAPSKRKRKNKYIHNEEAIIAEMTECHIKILPSKIRANKKIHMFIVHLVPQNWQGGHFLFLFFISEDRFYIHGRGQYYEYCPLTAYR